MLFSYHSYPRAGGACSWYVVMGGNRHIQMMLYEDSQ